MTRDVASDARTTAAGEELLVHIPAALASGAHQHGEEGPLIVYQIARAIDPRGSGRVDRVALARWCSTILSEKQFGRILVSAERYWEVEATRLRLRSSAMILATFDCEVVLSPAAVRFPISVLNTRPRRGAALVAAVLAGVDVPRSNDYIRRFTAVDRKTLSRWMKDDVIAAAILSKIPQWSER